MKKLLIFAIIAVLAFQVADAQRRKTSQDASSSYGVGYAAKQFYIGPTLGYGWGPAIGVDGEYTITDKQWLAFGAGGQMAYHLGYTDDYYWGDISYSMFSVSAFATYHLFPHKKFDVFARAGLAYQNWFTTHTGIWEDYGYSHSSGVNTIIEACLRYYFTPNMAFRASLGDPIWISVGLDFKLF